MLRAHSSRLLERHAARTDQHASGAEGRERRAESGSAARRQHTAGVAQLAFSVRPLRSGAEDRRHFASVAGVASLTLAGSQPASVAGL